MREYDVYFEMRIHSPTPRTNEEDISCSNITCVTELSNRYSILSSTKPFRIFPWLTIHCQESGLCKPNQLVVVDRLQLLVRPVEVLTDSLHCPLHIVLSDCSSSFTQQTGWMQASIAVYSVMVRHQETSTHHKHDRNFPPRVSSLLRKIPSVSGRRRWVKGMPFCRIVFLQYQTETLLTTIPPVWYPLYPEVWITNVVRRT